jgi:hypothetical protein
MRKDTQKKRRKIQKQAPLPKYLERINKWAAGIDMRFASHFVAVLEECKFVFENLEVSQRI